MSNPRLSITAAGNRQLILVWSNSVSGLVLEETARLGDSSLWSPSAASPTLQNNQFTLTLAPSSPTRFFRLHATGVLTHILETSPAHGESGVAVTRETIIRFNEPLGTNALVGPSNLYAEFGGRRLLSRPELSSDRKTATLFYPAEDLPGSARVRVTLVGDDLPDATGMALDADGDGAPGGAAVIEFDTLSITAVAQTAVIGRVFASELQPGPDTGTNALNRPLEGVIITVDGQEQTLRARTDAMGNFKLDPAPAGRFFVHVDGRTATGSQWPDGAYYPVVGKAWEAIAGKTDNLAGGTGEIFLPRIVAGTLKPVSSTSDTTIQFPADVLQKNPALAGVSITVPANSLFNDAGVRGSGKVGIAPVPPDRLPEKLPLGLDFPLVITVQTDGPSNFDRPAPVRFPNLPDPKTGKKLPPGAKSALWSFNHDTGRWEIQGSMTVSADGAFVESDAGVGIRQPGWHGTQPGCQGDGGGFGGPSDGGSGGPGNGGPNGDTANPLATSGGDTGDGDGSGSGEGGPDDDPDDPDDGDGDDCGKFIERYEIKDPFTLSVASPVFVSFARAGSDTAPEPTVLLGNQRVRLTARLLDAEGDPNGLHVTWEAPGCVPSTGQGLTFETRFPQNIGVDYRVNHVVCTQGKPGGGLCADRTSFRVFPCSGSQWVEQFPGSKSTADLLPEFRLKVDSFLASLTGASAVMNATFRPAKRAYLMHYSGIVARHQGALPFTVSLWVPPPFNPSWAAPSDPFQGELPINWVHLNSDGIFDPAASKQSARALFSGYGIVYPAALHSRHSEKRAIDVTIDWNTPSARFKWPEGVAKPTADAARAAFEAGANQPWPADVPLPDGTPGGFIDVPNASCLSFKLDADGNVVGEKFDNNCNPILHLLGQAYGVRKLVNDPPHWSDDGH